MHLVSPSNLKGQRILIVESEVSLSPKLQDALEDEGAETVVVPDPYSTSGAQSIARFIICAAVVNVAHSGVADALTVPVVVYGPNRPIPARVEAIVAELKRVLTEK
jgi:hypothetical protein